MVEKINWIENEAEYNVILNELLNENMPLCHDDIHMYELPFYLIVTYGNEEIHMSKVGENEMLDMIKVD